MVMMREPPGEPVTNSSLPSLNIMVGAMDDNGRLRGPGWLALPPVRPNAFGAPGLAAGGGAGCVRVGAVCFAEVFCGEDGGGSPGQPASRSMGAQSRASERRRKSFDSIINECVGGAVEGYV